MPKRGPEEVKLRSGDLQPGDGVRDLPVLLGDDLRRVYQDVAYEPISEELSALLAPMESTAAKPMNSPSPRRRTNLLAVLAVALFFLIAAGLAVWYFFFR